MSGHTIKHGSSVHEVENGLSNIDQGFEYQSSGHTCTSDHPLTLKAQCIFVAALELLLLVVYPRIQVGDKGWDSGSKLHLQDEDFSIPNSNSRLQFIQVNSRPSIRTREEASWLRLDHLMAMLVDFIQGRGELGCPLEGWEELVNHSSLDFPSNSSSSKPCSNRNRLVCVVYTYLLYSW